ncbi:MAG: 50S ribosomal protein L30 [Methanomassiliicoccales archaeon]
MAYAVIRVRGPVNVSGKIEDTLDVLNLTRVNHCSIVPQTPSAMGMIQKVKDYVTYGEISEETLARLIKFRGRLKGDRAVDDNYVMENSEFTSIMSLSKAVANDEARLRDIKDMKPVFRLHPPLKGYEGVKRSYQNGGALGYRGEDINKLIDRMLEE